jgi:hypothetical protein
VLKRDPRRAEPCRVIALVFMAPGFLAGLLIGRWWTLLFSLPPALWIGITSDVEVGGFLVGAGYGLLTALGIALGLIVRLQARRGSRRPS